MRQSIRPPGCDPIAVETGAFIDGEFVPACSGRTWIETRAADG